MGTTTNNPAPALATTLDSGQPQSPEVGTGSSAAPVNPGAANPPVPGAPGVPAGFKPLAPAAQRALKKPLAVQETHARGVASELAALEPLRDWQGSVGAGIPTPGALSGLLITAANWTDETTKAENYLAYVRNQRALAWDDALTGTEDFNPVLQVFVAGDATMAPLVVATESFLSARAEVAQRGAATRNAPKVTKTRATKATANAVKANADADAAAAVALAHGHGDATIVQPAPAAPSASVAPPAAAPAILATKGGTSGK